MVVGSKQDHTWEFDHAVVQGSDGFHIQVVGRFVKDQDVCTGDHHLGEQAADFLTTGEYTDLFHTVITGKQHTSEEATYISCIFDLGELCQPVYDRQIIVELFGAVLWKISLRCGDTPFERTFVRFHFAHQDLEEYCFCKFVAADKSDFVISSKCERNIIEYFYAVDGLGKILYHQYFIADLTFRTEINVRIFTAGRTDLIQLDFFQSTFSGSGLFGFGSVGTESGDKVL